MKMMKSTLLFEHNENYLNNLWYHLIWRMNLAHSNIILMTNFMTFLMSLWLHTLMIFWSTHSCYSNIEDMYEWYLNSYERLIYNVTSRSASFTQQKWCILNWLCSEKNLRWIQLKLKQSQTEKAHEMFMIYEHFSDLWIFIDDSYNTSQRLYNL